MKKENKKNKKKTPKNLKLIGVFGLGLAALVAGCGKSDSSAGDRAKSATDTATKKAGDMKDAVIGKEETRSELESRLSRVSTEYRAKIDQLENKQSTETVQEFIDANKRRIDSLKLSLHEANMTLEDLKKSSDADWKAKRDLSTHAFENTKSKIENAEEREAFRLSVRQKLTRIENKIESLQMDAANATAEAKSKIEEQRTMLEEKYTAVKADYAEFQTAAEDKWSNFKDGMSKSFKEISEAFKGLFD